MRNFRIASLFTALTAASVGFTGEADAQSSATDIIDYTSLLGEPPADFVKRCKSGGFGGKITKEKVDGQIQRSCTWFEGDEVFIVAISTHPKRENTSVTVGYHRRFFKAVNAELNRRYGYPTVEVPNANTDGWKLKYGGRNALMINTIMQSVGMLGLEYRRFK